MKLWMKMKLWKKKRRSKNKVLRKRARENSRASPTERSIRHPAIKDQEHNIEALTAEPKAGFVSKMKVLKGSRVFTDEDEIIMLQGRIECGLSLNIPASSITTNVLLEFLDGKLHSSFSKTQIYEKFRRLKQKFEKNMKMFKTHGGEYAVFSKPHDDTVFELSKKIWGGEKFGDNNPNGSDNNVENQILFEDRVDNDGKGKKLCSKVKRSLLTDEQDPLISMKKERLKEGIEIAIKKMKMIVELQKLQYEELKMKG